MTMPRPRPEANGHNAIKRYAPRVLISPRCEGAQYAGLVDRLERTARSEEIDNTERESRMRAISEQLQTFSQELTRLDRVIRDNGGVIDDK